MNSFSIRLSLIFIMFLVSIIAKAAPMTWEVVPNESSITFTATQNNAPVSGQFKSFK